MRNLFLAVAMVGLFVSTSFAQSSPATKTDVINATQTITTNASANKDAVTANDNANRDAIIQNNNQNRDVVTEQATANTTSILSAIEVVRLLVAPIAPPPPTPHGPFCNAPIGTRFVVVGNQICDTYNHGLLWNVVWSRATVTPRVTYSVASADCASQGKRLPTALELLSFFSAGDVVGDSAAFYTRMNSTGFTTGIPGGSVDGSDVYFTSELLNYPPNPAAYHYTVRLNGTLTVLSTDNVELHEYVCVQ